MTGMPPSDAASADDPKGLIREAYRIDGIEAAECRSILVDWALSLPQGHEPRAAIARLLQRHGHAAPDHPMTVILSEGLAESSTQPGRRGGASGRRRPQP